MGQILGIGTTHSPPLALPEAASVAMVAQALSAPNADPRYKERANWPAAMIAEMGDDDGIASSRAHRRRLIDNFRRHRRAIDAFAPDFIVIFGDDQYENFREDIIPPFCIYGLDDPFDSQPWSRKRFVEQGNAWGEANDWTFRLRGHREGAKFLTTALIARNVCMPYAYKPLHQPVLPTAFTNTLLYLDYDRGGFPHPVIPFHVNCYGSDVLKSKGRHRAALFETVEDRGLPDPPGPSAALCMDIGAMLAGILTESPYRVVLMASSSWSHAALATATNRMIPDHAADRVLLEAFKHGDYGLWRALDRGRMECAGQHEILNWMLLAGAMQALDRRPLIDDFMETYLFQANKCFATFPV